jgi:chorismate dehydratase
MVFGKIEYLNLLPFDVFMKRYLRGSSAKMAMQYHKGVPSTINKKFKNKKVDAAFISSINSKNCSKPCLGIIAKKNVNSVLVIPSDVYKKDSQSATSNVLAKILNINGEVLIGDKALKYYLQNDNYIDLALEWHKRYKLPFVFATLCFNKKTKLLKNIEKRFLIQSDSIKIPYYILKSASKKSGISQKEIQKYLKLISYKIDKKSLKSLKLFLRKVS